MKVEAHKRFVDRLRLADFTLGCLKKKDMPNLELFLKRAKVLLYEVPGDVDITLNNDSQRNKHIELSALTCEVVVSIDDHPVVEVYSHREMSESQTSLFVRSVKQVLGATYAAMGLDMSGLFMDESEITTKEAKQPDGA